MVPRQSATSQQEAVSDSPRCNIWWHLVIVGGLFFGALTILGSWSAWLTVRAAELDNRVTINATKAVAVEKTLDDLRADVKELLRRTPASTARAELRGASGD